MDALPSVVDVLQARPDDRELLHRLSPASLRLALHRAGMSFTVHLLPVAPDRRRAPLPGAKRRERRGGDGAGREALFPQVKEFFFDDDTFTDDLPRAEEIARRLGRLGITWSCNAKANVPAADAWRSCGTTVCGCCSSATSQATQQILNNIKKGMRLDIRPRVHARREVPGHHDPRDVHPGLAGRDAARRSRRRSASPCEIEPDTIQVSAGGPVSRARICTGRRRSKAGFGAERVTWSNCDGVQVAAARAIRGLAPNRRSSIRSKTFYRRFYFRPRKMIAIAGGMLRDPAVMRRRLREGAEFFRFLRERRASLGDARVAACASLTADRRSPCAFCSSAAAISVGAGWESRSSSGPQLERFRPGRSRGAVVAGVDPDPGGARSPDGTWSGPIAISASYGARSTRHTSGKQNGLPTGARIRLRSGSPTSRVGRRRAAGSSDGCGARAPGGVPRSAQVPPSGPQPAGTLELADQAGPALRPADDRLSRNSDGGADGGDQLSSRLNGLTR